MIGKSVCPSCQKQHEHFEYICASEIYRGITLLSASTAESIDNESESDIRTSMVTHTRNSCSEFNPSKVHTHTAVNTHLEQWAAIYAAVPGEQLGIRCLAQGHLSRGIDCGVSALHSLPPPTIPAGLRLELTNFQVRVRL